MIASIVILTYRNLEDLKNALNSCFLQKYSDIEIVISDDGSPNFKEIDMGSLCKSRGDNIKNIFIRHSEVNCGTVHNFNEALKLCTGGIIIPLACDDTFFNSESVGNIMCYFEQEKVLLATCKQLQIEPNKSPAVSPHLFDRKLLLNDNFYKTWYQITAFPCFIGGSCTCYRRELFDRYGDFDSSYYLLEDWPMYAKLLENEERIGFIDHITVKHNYGGVSSKHGGRNLRLIEDDLKCLQSKIDYLGWGNLKAMDRRLLEYRKQRLLLELGSEKKWIPVRYIDAFLYHIIRKVVREFVKRATGKRDLIMEGSGCK